MPPQIQRWGSITILSGLGGTLLAAAIIWMFGQVSNVAPVVKAVDRLTITLGKMNNMNIIQYNQIIELIHKQDIRITRCEEDSQCQETKQKK